MKIIPAILPQRFSEIVSSVEAVSGAVDTVQIDLVDGVFAPSKTWLFNGKDEQVLAEFEREERGMPQWEMLNYEFDLMIKDPLKHIDRIMMLGPAKIIFHFESFETGAMLEYFEQLPEIVRTTVSFGIALGIGTPPEDVAPFIPFISSIQCMGIAQVGFQGNPFDVRALAQIRQTKELYPSITVSVDGGVNHASIPLIAEAGADSVVVGSAVFGNENPRGTIKALQHVCIQSRTTTTSENLN
jgi:ribulose-phosphate 3-epimerase